MLKPWLLLTDKEKEQRKQDYLAYTSGSLATDEGLAATLKPPETAQQAAVELYLALLETTTTSN